MMNSPASQCLLTLYPPYRIDNCVLTEVVGHEALSKPFYFQLILRSTHQSINCMDWLGKSLTFQINVDGSDTPRHFNGVIHDMLASPYPTQGYYEYQLSLVPWLSLLTLNKDCRIFQNQSALEIVTELFKEFSFVDFDISGVRAGHPKHDYYVQYQEATFDFIQRLLADAGIVYYFRHSEKKHIMVLTDQDSAYPVSDIDESEEYQWSESSQFCIDQVTIEDHHCLFPEGHLTASETTNSNDTLSFGNFQRTQYRYPGDFSNLAEGADKARWLLQSHRAKQREIKASSSRPSFYAGLIFKGNLITQMTHYAHDNKNFKGVSHYHNEFKCIPEGIVFRPSMTSKKPEVIGVQSAVVVGPDHHPIYTDALGRIKVQFHWDRRNPNHFHSDCWLRVRQDWAGHQWGSLFLPRVGQEVLVAFENADPNRPVVVGSVGNARDPNQSGIQSNTLQTHQLLPNEIKFDDTHASEQLLIRAANNLNQQVYGSLTEQVSQQQSCIIKAGDWRTKILSGKHIVHAANIHHAVCDSDFLLNHDGIYFNSKAIRLVTDSGKAKGIARVGDFHQCPKQTLALQAHVGGPILKGSPNVIINGRSAARVGDPLYCEYETDQISEGVKRVLVNNHRLALQHHQTAHSGTITVGSVDVVVEVG